MAYWQITQRTRCFLGPKGHGADRMQLNLYLRECLPNSLNQVRPLPESGDLIEREYAYIVCTSETADNSYEVASDTFVIQNGSIRLQAFTAKVKPKH